MGLLRFLRALAVVFAHAGNGPFGYRIVRADLAVECFYMISGFYMALILNEKYLSKRENRIFYINRALRIYSVYFAALLLALFIALIDLACKQGPLSTWNAVARNLPWFDKASPFFFFKRMEKCNIPAGTQS
jgi:peptidoglycan/LPS O-acetylase OafA/YrhL